MPSCCTSYAQQGLVLLLSPVCCWKWCETYTCALRIWLHIQTQCNCRRIFRTHSEGSPTVHLCRFGQYECFFAAWTFLQPVLVDRNSLARLNLFDLDWTVDWLGSRPSIEGPGKGMRQCKADVARCRFVGGEGSCGLTCTLLVIDHADKLQKCSPADTDRTCRRPRI